MQPVLAIHPITKAVRLPQRPVPGVPDHAIGLLDRDLANVVQDRGGTSNVFSPDQAVSTDAESAASPENLEPEGMACRE